MKSMHHFQGASMSLSQRVLEVIEVLSVFNPDIHLAGEAFEFAGTRIRHNCDSELRSAARHRRIVLQHEASALAVQRSGHPLDGNVTSRTLYARARAQHLALAGSFKSTVE